MVQPINSVNTEYDHLLAPPYIIKREDLGVPTIECTIKQMVFPKTFCDTGSEVNVMSKVA